MSFRAAFLRSTPAARKLLWRLAARRAADTAAHLQPYLRPGESLLDIGAGICDITLRLQQAGHPVTALDVQNFSCTPLIQPVLYDGRHMPFQDKQFSTALILTVLHHIPASEHGNILDEAARVAKRIIIIEDVHHSRPHKLVTMSLDSLFNMEFFGHPHSNRNDHEWQALFKRHGLTLTTVKASRSFGVLRHRLYVLETPS